MTWCKCMMILATAVGWIAYDFAAYFCGGEALTISWATDPT